MFKIFKNTAVKTGIAFAILFAFILGYQPLAAGLAAQPDALEASQKHETIFVNLDHYGNIIGMISVNAFINAGDNVVDYGDYSKITNLTNDSVPEINEDLIIFSNVDNEKVFRYQGALDTIELPWEFNISYYLDGSNINAQELAGENGRLRIVIDAAYNGEAHPYFTQNYMLQIRIPLRMDKAFAINAPDASIMYAGNTATVAFTLMPESVRKFSLEADVTNFSMGGIDIAAMKVVVPANEDIDEIESGFEDMAEGTQELIDGTQKLKQGMVELDAGVGEILDGAGSLSRGLSGLSGGLNEFSDGLAGMENGLKEITAGSEGFKQALGAMSDALPQLTGGYENIESGLSSLLANEETLNALSVSLAQSQDPQVRMLAEAMLMQLGALSELQSGLKRANEGLSAHSGGINELSNRFGEFNQGLRYSADGAQELNRGFNDMKTAAQRLSSGMHGLRGGLGELKDNIGTLPEDVQMLVDGQTELKDGVLTAKEEIRQFTAGSGDAETVSFVSPLRANAETVQFVLRTPAVEVEKSPETYESIEERMSIWDRFLDLFRKIEERFL